MKALAELVHDIRFLKPAHSFRANYDYDNVLYIVAGHVIDLVSGQTYEDYVREHVFKPAGMVHATSDEAHRFATPNRAASLRQPLSHRPDGRSRWRKSQHAE